MSSARSKQVTKVLANSLTALLREIVGPMPPGSSVTLPVEWLRAQLDATGGATPAPQDTFAADMSVEEVAKLMGRKPSTVRGWCRSGELQGYRLHGRDWRISHEALNEYQSRQRTKPTPQVARRTSGQSLSSWRREIAA